VQAEEIRALSDEDLAKELESARAELFNLRFQGATGRLAESNLIGRVKRDIARLLTIRRERDSLGRLRGVQPGVGGVNSCPVAD